MGPDRIKAFFTGLLKVALYVLFGLLVFTVTTLLLYRRGHANVVAGFSSITDRDSCRLEYPHELRKTEEGMILLYVLTRPCANCSESIIKNMVSSLNESGLTVEPAMLYHPLDVSDTVRINAYYDKFAPIVDLVVSCEDSIMTNNPWLPDGLGFYGIVTDSLDMVRFAGSILDPGFMACCIKEFGKTQGQTSRW